MKQIKKNKFRKYFDILLIFSFVFLLCFPYLGSALGISSRVDNSERRKLVTFPAIPINLPLSKSSFEKVNFSTFSKFIPQLNYYINDNFGFRNILIKLYLYLKINILRTQKIFGSAIGNNGWIFEAPAPMNDYNAYYNNLIFSDEQLKRISNNLKSQNKVLKRLGIPFILITVPKKQSIYSEFYPFPEENAYNLKYKQLTSYLKTNYKGNFIDTQHYLLAAKKDIPLYYKTDTHWNNLGAFTAYREIMNLLLKYKPDLRLLTLDDFNVNIDKYELWEGDSGFRFPPNDPGHPEYGINFSIKEIAKRKDKLPKVIIYGDSYLETNRSVPRGVFLDEFPQLKNKLHVMFTNPNDLNYLKPKDKVEKLIGIIRDNFSDKFLQEKLINFFLNTSVLDGDPEGLNYFLKFSFQETISHIFVGKIDIHEIEKEKPDLIILEVSLPSFDYLLRLNNI